MSQDVLLERIERDIIRYASFKVSMLGMPDSTTLECDMMTRGPLVIKVERRHGFWVMTDRCSTVRQNSWLWSHRPDEVAAICQINGVVDNLGELWLYIDTDQVFMSLCSLLCAMLEIETKVAELRKGERS